MVSRTRETRARSKSKGKRRAVSPASSVSSNNTIGEEFLANNAKRIKTEPGEIPEESSTAIVPGDDDPPTSTPAPLTPAPSNPATSNSVDRRHRTNGSRIAQDANIDDEDRSKSFAPPADLLEILSTARTATKKFQGRIEEVIDNSFRIAPRDEHEAPGLGYIECILECLKNNDVVTGRIDEVRQHLRRTRRYKIAEHLGSTIISSDELRETLNAVVAALPFRLTHNGFIFRPSPNNQPETSAVEARGTQATALNDRESIIGEAPAGRTSDADNSPRQAKRERFESDGGVNAVITRMATEHSGKSQCDAAEAGPRGNAVVANSAGVASLTPPDTPFRSFKERFPEPFDLFLYYVRSNPAATGIGIREQNVGGHEGFREIVKTIFESLSPEERHRWRQMHKQVRKGDNMDLAGTACQTLLEDQHIVEKVRNESLLVRRPRGPASRLRFDDSVSMQPMVIPFILKSKLAHRSAMIVLNTPDTPNIDVSEDRMSNACERAFGHGSSFERVEAWTDQIWVMTFANRASAAKVKGRALSLDSMSMKIEHLYSRAPSFFTGDLTNVSISDEEIASRLMHAFGSEPKPTVYMQESPKLYRGRFLWISLPPVHSLIRFYIPMRDTSGAVRTVCFKPINHTADCEVCTYKHGTDPCSTKRAIEMPSK